jgi:hypothetical protein
MSETALLPGEQLAFDLPEQALKVTVPDAAINEKYARGEVRIVTEQARYPLNTVAGMVDSPSYTLSPEYQRRHRWSVERQSRLIESLIMNVPVPPIFLYEYEYSKYEVMDGQQRLTAIHDFYRNKFALKDLAQWPELNGRTYDRLPDKIKEGIDRRYLSSVILLKETARTPDEAQRLKQLVFERLNSGGAALMPQEMRNAIFDGPLNQICMRLSKTPSLCRLWDIPEPEAEELAGGQASEARLQHEAFRRMEDVELVLRFFAYRQKHRLHSGGVSLSRYLDTFLRHGNGLDASVLAELEGLFTATIDLAEVVFGEKAFWLYRRRGRGKRESWNWLSRPTTAAYDPMMFVLSQHITRADELRNNAERFQASIERFYQENYDTFGGRDVNAGTLRERETRFAAFIETVLAQA